MADTANTASKADKVYKRDYVLMKEVTGEVVEVPIDKGMLAVTHAMLRGCVQTSPEAVAAVKNPE